jgi:hypothetical protein
MRLNKIDEHEKANPKIERPLNGRVTFRTGEALLVPFFISSLEGKGNDEGNWRKRKERVTLTIVPKPKVCPHF